MNNLKDLKDYEVELCKQVKNLQVQLDGAKRRLMLVKEAIIDEEGQLDAEERVRVAEFYGAFVRGGRCLI